MHSFDMKTYEVNFNNEHNDICRVWYFYLVLVRRITVKNVITTGSKKGTVLKIYMPGTQQKKTGTKCPGLSLIVEN